MRPLEHIRRDILKISQAEMARIAGATQGTVSRWEKGSLEPDRDQLAMIRDEVIKRGAAWGDHLFFEEPADAPPTSSGAAA